MTYDEFMDNVPYEEWAARVIEILKQQGCGEEREAFHVQDLRKREIVTIGSKRERTALDGAPGNMAGDGDARAREDEVDRIADSVQVPIMQGEACRLESAEGSGNGGANQHGAQDVVAPLELHQEERDDCSLHGLFHDGDEERCKESARSEGVIGKQRLDCHGTEDAHRAAQNEDLNHLDEADVAQRVALEEEHRNGEGRRHGAEEDEAGKTDEVVEDIGNHREERRHHDEQQQNA